MECKHTIAEIRGNLFEIAAIMHMIEESTEETQESARLAAGLCRAEITKNIDLLDALHVTL